MNFLLKPIQKNLFKQKPSWLLLGITLYPFILILASFFNTNFMQLDGADASISVLEFVSAILYTQHQFIFPFIILAFIASTLFYDEIKSGRLVIFKDKPKAAILSSKRLALFILFILYFLVLSIASILTYYLYINNLPIASNTFLPLEDSEIKRVFFEIMGYFLTEIIGLSVALTLSIVLTSGYTILVTIFYQLLTMLAPNLDTLKYFFPIGYSGLYKTTSEPLVLLYMFLVTGISLLISRLVAKYLFSKIEY